MKTLNLKLSDMVNSVNGFQDLVNKDMPIKLALKLMKIATNVNQEVKIFEEAKQSLFKKYGTEDEETNRTTIPEEHVKEFSDDMMVLLSEEVELVVPDMITTKELMAIKESVKPSTLMSIDWIVKDE